MVKNRFDPDLVLRAKKGDSRATELLLGRLKMVLNNFYIRRVGSRAIVDDLVQNSLLRVHKSLKSLKDPEKFKAFSMKAAVFELHDFYRGRHSGKESLYDPTEILGTSSSDRTASAGSKIDLEVALSILSPHARKILELREYGYKYKEIAEMVGTTPQAVKMQVKRAFDKMRRTFANRV